jgi:hypothetical protein
MELAPLIAGVSEQRLQERIHPEQGCKQQDAAVAILDVSGMDDGVEQQTQRIYQNVALLALDLLARIIAMRSMQAPLFRRFSRSGCRRWQRSGGVLALNENEPIQEPTSWMFGRQPGSAISGPCLVEQAPFSQSVR